MGTNSLTRVWDSVADRGRELLARRAGAKTARTLETLCADLLSERGEASGTALAREVLEIYRSDGKRRKLAFFELLRERYAPDPEALLAAADAYRGNRSAENLLALTRATEPPRQELIRRLNLAPHGTELIVGMRRDLLQLLPDHPELSVVDADFEHLLSSWFNRGFLVLHRIDWRTPAAILEKLFQYEAVHEIRGWDDMRRRLERDRGCFAFFHPALPDEPVIFVEVALLGDLAQSIQPLLDTTSRPLDTAKATTAILYSISNCQDGLRGISFGSFLIKQVIGELVEEYPRLRTFATLSPVPGFRRWLDASLDRLSEADRALLTAVDDEPGKSDSARVLLLRLCAHFLLREKEDGEPLDPVARFHLRNGASVERINWCANDSGRGMRQSHGIMVNYAYRLHQIERNHEAYVNRGRVAASGAVRALLKKDDPAEAASHQEATT